MRKSSGVKSDAMRAVIYARVSTKEQAQEGYSIDYQLEKCREHLTSEGWLNAGEFVDRGESALSKNRPQYLRMLQRLEEDSSIKYVLALRYDRLARNFKDQLDLEMMEQDRGFQIVAVLEPIERSAIGKFMKRLLQSQAEYYSEELSQKIRLGMERKIKEGHWPNMAPVGYRNIRVNGRATIEPDEQAGLIRQAFELYAGGTYNLRDLTTKMRALGLNNKRGTPITRSTLASVLKNVAYTGQIPRNGAVYPGSHEPIVDQALFEKVQGLLGAHSQGDHSWKHDHPLKGMLICGECGSRMIYHLAKGGRFKYFACISNSARRGECSQKYVPLSKIEKRVEALYRGIKIPDEKIREIEAILDKEIIDRERGRLETGKFLEKRLTAILREKDRLVDLYMKELLDEGSYRDRKGKLEREQAEIEHDLAGRSAELKEAKEVIRVAMDIAKNVAAEYVQASPEVRKLFNRAFFRKLTVREGRVVRVQYEEPFAHLLSSNKRVRVETTGRSWNRSLPLFDLVRARSA